MNIPLEVKKQEAIQRMKALRIFPQTIKQFKSGMVSCSEPPMGANYWVSEDQKKIIKEFEEEHNALVYFVIRSYTEDGKLDTLLYVSDYMVDWEADMEDINEGYILAYTYNYNVPYFSEIGSIAVTERFGGLVRLY